MCMDREGSPAVAGLMAAMFVALMGYGVYHSLQVVDATQYRGEPVQTGVVESKDINYTSGFLGSETKHFHVEIDGRAYKVSMEDWNKIKEDEEVEYVEGNNGKIRVTETGN